jgi:hypothetical protein
MRIARLSLLVLSLLALAAPFPAWADRQRGAGEPGGGDAYCPRRALLLGDVVVQPGRCYLVAVLRDHRGTFLAFLPATTALPPGDAMGLDGPAGRRLASRILYLVPVQISDQTVLAAVDTVRLVQVRLTPEDGEADQDEDVAGPGLIVILPGSPQDVRDSAPPGARPPALPAGPRRPVTARPDVPAGAPRGSSLPGERDTRLLVRRITAGAREMVGTPYVWGGASRSGVDCSGLVYMLYAPYVPELPRTSYGQFAMGTRVPRADLRPGDLVFFDTDGSGASHVGIYTGEAEFVTVSSSAGRVITARLDNPYWAGHYIGARRLLP